MINEVGLLGQQSFGQYATWPQSVGAASDEKHVGLSTALLQAMAISPPLPSTLAQAPENSGRARLRKPSKEGEDAITSANKPKLYAELASPAPTFTSSSLGSSPAESTSSWNESSSPLTSRVGHSPSPFADSPTVWLMQSSHCLLSEDASALRPQPSLKRRRPVTDVDGPDTASLGSKKRRLRRDLITSRLSQPFSLPATHILNREAVAVGDKSFLKLAAIMAVRRLDNAVPTAAATQHGPSPSSLLHRVAVMNRVRLRLHAEAIQRGDARLVHIAENVALLQYRHGLGGLVAGTTRFPALAIAARLPLIGGKGSGPPTAIVNKAVPVVGHRPVTVVPPTVLRRHSPPASGPSPLSRAPAEVHAASTARSAAELVQGAAALGAISSSGSGGSEDWSEDDRAFPTSELESRYDSSDEPDDVYTDFSVIFGGPPEADLSDGDGEMDHVEDYMDDLDGIPWTAR